ncbi:hypothetical protein SteCoe_36247 [Stentor coeruleus]|uniref:Uncharacterized protein n=1 Tax=Stentor coeruleus TaxID=5963 RepID=A0A1R2AQM5_9CILI|nr:hypothetical protein SteCoe_36247 [Stentor coeruleus]
MSKTSRTKGNPRSIPIPKHLLHYRKDVSPYSNSKDKKQTPVSKTFFSSRSRLKPSLKREKTMTDSEYFEDTLACLINVERNYVKELLNSPTKYKSKSPITSKKSTANTSPIKACSFGCKFETLTTYEFSHTSKNSIYLRRNKSSITPDPFTKKK